MQGSVYFLVVRQGSARGRVEDCRRFQGARPRAVAAAEKLERRLNHGLTAAEAETAALGRARLSGSAARLESARCRLRFVSVLAPAMAAPLLAGGPRLKNATFVRQLIRVEQFETAGDVLQNLEKHWGDERLRVARR